MEIPQRLYVERGRLLKDASGGLKPAPTREVTLSCIWWTRSTVPAIACAAGADRMAVANSAATDTITTRISRTLLHVAHPSHHRFDCVRETDTASDLTVLLVHCTGLRVS